MSRFQPPSARFTASSSSRPSTPQRQETATAPYTQQSAQQQPRRYQSQHEEEPLLRCQSCKQELPMHLLAEHDCRGGEPRRRPPETLRVDVTAATARGGYGASLSARSPMYSGNLEVTPPLTPGSRPASPSGYNNGDELSRSASSLSSASSNGGKLPFFERYKNLVGNSNGNMAGIGTGGLSRSSPSDNLAAQPNSRRPPSPGAPSPGLAASSASPSPYTSNFPSRVSPTTADYSRQRPDRTHDGSAGRPSPSQASFRSDSRPALETPASSVRSQTPPRSRKVSMNERGAIRPAEEGVESELAYEREDNRRTITGSQSTPARLSSYALSNPALQTQPRRPQQAPPLQPQPSPPPAPVQPPRSAAQASSRPSNSRSNTGNSVSADAPRPGMTRSLTSGSSDLDEVLEDLRLMTEEDQEEPAVLDQFFGRPSDEYEDRAPPPRLPILPYSQSSPTLMSATIPSPINAGTPSTSSSGFDRLASKPTPAPTERCTTCRKPVAGADLQKGGDGHLFCRSCYNERFLPECRRCRKKIEGGAVTSSDGKVAGKYHPKCFTCWKCSESFSDKEFYVFDAKPYCATHWHELNGSLCSNVKCGLPIEGPCVSLVGEENGGGGRYHPEHFVCAIASCAEPLMEHHFVVAGLPFCEKHAQGPPPAARPRKAGVGVGAQEPATARARKRQTIITKR